MIQKRPRSTLQRVGLLGLVGAGAFALGFHQGSKTSETPPAPPQAEPQQAAAPKRDLPAERESALELSEKAAIQTPVEPPEADTRELGYESAQTNLSEALQRLQRYQGPEKANFARGVFDFLGRSAMPDFSLKLALDQGPDTQGIALKSLVAAWTADATALTEAEAEQRSAQVRSASGNRLGLATELSSFLSGPEIDPRAKQAWAAAFASGPERSEIYARLYAGDKDAIPLALDQAKESTSWERRNFEASLAYQWAQKDPQQAWDWYRSHGYQLESPQSKIIIDAWAQRQPTELAAALESLPQGETRAHAIESIARNLARVSTEDALNWSESLNDPNDQNAAYQAVYQATPKGIGAIVSSRSGFVQVEQIMAGGALEKTDVRPGDLIVELREADGPPVDLYGSGLRSAIRQLRGPPGTDLEIRYLRPNAATGQLEERSARVTRDLLIQGKRDD